MNQIVVEINGTGTHNRGAELMAIAISDQVRKMYPGAKLVVPPRFGTKAERDRYGFDTTWEAVGSFGRVKTFLRSLMWRFKKDVINPSSVDLVIDASGFAFSDQWGPTQAEVLTRKMNRSYRKGQPLFLLPQAFGPFDIPEVKTAVAALFARSELIFARDSRSFTSASQLAGPHRVHQYPDFTVAVEPVEPSGFALPEQFVSIVPNLRMMDMTDTGDKYLCFLKSATHWIQEQNLDVAFVLHDAEEDRRVIELLGPSFSHFPVLTHDDPRALKWILGRSEFVIGSRFHALVSSLSQGVPCIGAGWSHKYPELFYDFGCPDLLISDMGNVEALRSVVKELCNSESRADRHHKIATESAKLKMRTALMWHEIEVAISKLQKSARA